MHSDLATSKLKQQTASHKPGQAHSSKHFPATAKHLLHAPTGLHGQRWHTSTCRVPAGHSTLRVWTRGGNKRPTSISANRELKQKSVLTTKTGTQNQPARAQQCSSVHSSTRHPSSCSCLGFHTHVAGRSRLTPNCPATSRKLITARTCWLHLVAPHWFDVVHSCTYSPLHPHCISSNNQVVQTHTASAATTRLYKHIPG
jgi:hypothetical protein